jgi:hypothetical protein
MALTAAFLHIQQVVGGDELAEEDLRLRLASGDVEAQDRSVTLGEGIDIIPLKPELFRDPDPLWFGPYGLGQNMFLRIVEIQQLQCHNFFLRRAERPSLLEACELYQIAHMDKAEKNAARDLLIHKEIADYTVAEWDWIKSASEFARLSTTPS